MSPELGRLDEAAFDDALRDDADGALALLADMASASDERLRALARRLAGRVALRLNASGPARAVGVGRLRRDRWQAGSDLDVDASLDALVAPAPPSLDDLTGTRWARPATAIALVVDRSGSMSGARLAAAAMAAAAVAFRAPAEHCVLAFSDDVVVLKGIEERRSVEAVVDDVLALRGHGPTDLAFALRTAREQLARAGAAHRVVLLLSDGRATRGGDPVPEARRLEHFLVLAPAGDADDARALAAAAGGRCAELAGPSSVPAAVAALLG